MKVFKKIGVTTQEEARKWMVFRGISIKDIKKFKEANIKPTEAVKSIFEHYGFYRKR